MAIKAVGTDITLVAGADLSAQQYRAVKINSSGLAIMANATDLNQIGILQDKPASGQVGTVRTEGITKARAGAAVTAGDRVTSDANGSLIVATTGRQVMGIALTSAVNNDIFTVLLSERGVV
jgi:hypothetical protein